MVGLTAPIAVTLLVGLLAVGGGLIFGILFFLPHALPAEPRRIIHSECRTEWFDERDAS